MHRLIRQSAPSVLALLALLWLSGCSSTTRTHDPHLPLGDARALTPAHAISVEELAPLKKYGGRLVVTEGKHLGKTFDFHQVSDTPKNGAKESWIMTVEGKQRRYSLRNADGCVFIPREEDMLERAWLEYEPPLRCPDKFDTKAPFKGSCYMRLRSLSDNAVREEGKCEYCIELLGKQEIETPAGTFNAHIVRTVRHLSLRLATVKITVHEAFTPERGAVALRVERVIRILGVFPTTQIEEYRLTK